MAELIDRLYWRAILLALALLVGTVFGAAVGQAVTLADLMR
jgi:hypothetical protein